MLIENAPPQPFNGYKLKHPRLRGEDGFESCQPRHTKETPPLTRGRRLPRRQCLPRRWKHPRLRGEDAPAPSLSSGARETPPLTRGRHKHSRRLGFRLRNTPAYAGKTYALSRLNLGGEKHPRLRGEDVIESPEVTEKKETPPLTRGRRSARRAKASRDGNTPAYAGKTRQHRPLPSNRWKHPRLRGEDDLFATRCAISIETPPLTRGRPFREAVENGDWETPPLTRGRPTR